MLKNKFLLAFVALIFGTTLNAQTITIDDARLLGALPTGGSYGSGSSVAVPVTLNGCFAQNNVFTWKLYNGASATGDSGKITAFYITFMNVTLPIGLATGNNYNIQIKATTVGSVAVTSAAFPVTNVATPIVAKATPVISDLILRDEYYYGICDGNALPNMSLRDSSTAGGTDSLELVNNYTTGPSSKYTPVAGKFNLLFNPTYTFGKSRDAYYTAFVKSISPSNIVSTKAYHIINNSWDVLTYVEAKSFTYSCAGDTISLVIVSDLSQVKHIQQNFPAALLRINWSDGNSNTLSQCEILAANGKVRHHYDKGSCDAPNQNTNYKITSTVNNPFYVFNGNGVTATCAAGAEDVTSTSIFTKPKASFKVDSVVCANDTIKFRNFSNPGQGVANIGSSLTCAQLANYTWVIDGNVANPIYQTQPGKVEPRKDTSYVFNSNQPGYHTASLYINNNYGNFSPCPAQDTTRTFCVDTARARPAFQMDSAGTGVLKDSIIGCAPVFCIKNTTKRTFCVDTSQFKYYWRVLDATSTGPNYLEVPQNGNYSFKSGTNKNSKSPCISIDKSGKYFIELMASATCAIDSSLAVRKYVEANGDAGVNFPPGTDTIRYCMPTANTQLTINYSPLAPINPQLTIYDSVNYIYQSSAGGALSYLWTVTPGVYGIDYDFINGPSDSTARYPQIRIKKRGLYKVTVVFSNNCQPKTATQYIAFREPIRVSAGTNTGVTDSICHTTDTFRITGASAGTLFTNAAVGEIFWSSDGDGIFIPQAGIPTTPNIFNPFYLPGPIDKANSCINGKMFTISMSAIGVQPQSCAVGTSPRKLFVRPCVTVADTAFNSCSGSSVNYSIKQPGLVGSTFTWVPNVIAGVVNGTTNGSGIKITDILTGNGIVQYTLLPQKDGCVGNPFTVTVTVRPRPNKPTVTLLHPSNPTRSMCSGDTAIIQLTSTNSTDKFNWTSYNYIGKISGNTNGVYQPGLIRDTLNNTKSPLLVDSVTYVFTTNSVFGCSGGLNDSVTVVVTPGPNIAATVGKLHLVCNSTCDSLKANVSGPAGIGYWTVKTYLPNPKPIFADSTSNITQVCGLVPGAGVTYEFVWNIAPLLAGCNPSSDFVKVIVFDTLTTPNAGNDTAFCNADGNILRSIPLKGSTNRSLITSEYFQWRIIFGPIGGQINPVQSLNSTLFFKEPGVYTIGFFTANGACTNKEDTVIIRVFGKPKGGSFAIAPNQSSYCQGTPMTLTANIDYKYDSIAYWKFFQSPYNGLFQNEGFNQNPYFRPGVNVQRSEGVYAVLYSKGWYYGCKDSTLSSGTIIYVDSTTIAGSIFSSDSIICTANSVVKLKLKGSRGRVISWIRSTVGPNGPYVPFGSGNPLSVPVPTTTWYKAIVQNGACSIDTTSPFRVFLPTGTDAAKAGSDTILCGADTFRLSGNVPVVGNGYWKMIGGLFNDPSVYPGNIASVFTFDGTTNNTTTTNPVVANISQYGVYQFVWTIKNLTCDATGDTVTIVNTQPIANNMIGTVSDTVCAGTKIVVTAANNVSGGGALITFNWQFSTNAGASWTLGSNAALSYTFTAIADVWVRRVVKSDSCTDYGNTIKFVVQPTLANNTITPASNAVCVNTPAPNITGSLPTGGSGNYTYTWNYGNNIDTATKLWINPNVNNPDYNPAFNLTDTIHFRRIIVSGKCTDTSAISTVIVYPDAKANYISSAPNNNTRCAPYSIGGDVTNIILNNTNYDWYITTSANVRTLINSGNQFSGYTIANGLDNVKLTLIATSTTVPACKTDSMSMTFNTSATPIASFTISAPLGCADNTGTNATNFVFTNTTPNKALFPNVNWNLNSSTLTNSGLIDLPSGGFQFKPSTTGLDTVYTITLTVNSPSCGSSQFSDTVRIRTSPKVSFGLSPTYQCSGGIITFTNQTVGSPNLTWNWVFGDNTPNTTTPNTTHTYNVSSLTTYIPTLIATNECASDSAKNSVVIAANTVTLNISVKGSDKYKCLPDTVTFYTNSIGGTTYFWDFGDGSFSVPNSKDKDTVTHIYTKSGKYIISLTGSTTCGSVTKTDSVFAYGTPIVAYSIAPNTTVCKGDTVRFTNLTDTASSYVWNFGNGSGGGINPTRTYANSGTYSVKLTATRFHTLPLGGVLPCTDTSSIQTVTIRDTMPASFSITPLGASCLPYAVQFTNTTNITTLPISTTNWTFGEPVAQSGNTVSHTYNQLGQYNVNLTVTNAGNCTYIDSQKVTVAGPIGTWTHDTGYVCGNTPVNFQINASSTDSITINYGDATIVTTVPFSTFPNPFTHVYLLGGNYTPTVTLKSVNGCTYFIAAFGTIRVDYVKAGYTINTPLQNCGNTVQGFTNTTTMYQAPLAAVYSWNINGVTYNVPSPSVTFNTSGVYNVRMQVTSISGCFDSVATAPLFVKVNNIPNILSITRQDTACAGQAINYTAVLSPSEDPINNYNWNFGNGTTGSGISSQTIYGAAGIFTDTLTVVTSKGCPSTLVRGGLVIRTSPVVSISPSTDTLICAGSSLTLTASGANTYSWSPNIALTPSITSPIVTVAPPNLTKYVVTGFNLSGCSDTASIRVSTVNDYAITISASPNDSLCKGDSISLTVVGAPSGSSIVWSPSTGITTSPTAMSVMVKPNFTTLYTVTVNDLAFCFPHTETVSVGVGDTTKVSLGLDTVYLQGGTVYPLTPSVVNGPIGTWNWTPATNLSCSDCGNPIATVKSNICYNVEATSIYGCKAYDDICIIAFCEASQVFIPNAFTPDGDGINDYLWIKARGIKSVKSFRIFNRWGQVVFERANFTPVDYDRINSWDGKIKGIIAPTEVYVYTCEVMCENGNKFTYTGNIAVIK